MVVTVDSFSRFQDPSPVVEVRNYGNPYFNHLIVHQNVALRTGKWSLHVVTSKHGKFRSSRVARYFSRHEFRGCVKGMGLGCGVIAPMGWCHPEISVIQIFTTMGWFPATRDTTRNRREPLDCPVPLVCLYWIWPWMQAWTCHFLVLGKFPRMS